MKTAQLKASVGFDVLLASKSAQATVMVLPPGESTGELINEHPGSEQWLFVISGSGMVIEARRRIKIRRNSLVLIQRRELHRVVNNGRRPLVTLNFYVPPAYTKQGEPKPMKGPRSRAN